MVPDGKGIDDRIGGLDVIAQIVVKTVVIDTVSGDGAVETAKTSAAEGGIPGC